MQKYTLHKHALKIVDIEKVIKILSKHFFYEKRTTLNRHKKESPFKILISCLLSLRTQDKNTEITANNLFKMADTPEKILKLPIKKLEELIYKSGHYRKKARVIKHVSKEIIERFGGKVPNNKEELLSIKGIGQKTANIVLAFAFNKNVLPIDTHCHRIPNRLGWIKTKTPEETEKALMQIVPEKYWREFNALFVLFGKTICKPISPLCSQCPVEEYCKKVGVMKHR